MRASSARVKYHQKSTLFQGAIGGGERPGLGRDREADLACRLGARLDDALAALPLVGADTVAASVDVSSQHGLG